MTEGELPPFSSLGVVSEIMCQNEEVSHRLIIDKVDHNLKV
jgi:hypothetical protein